MTAPVTVWQCDRCGGKMLVLRANRAGLQRPKRVGRFVFRTRRCRDCGLQATTVEGLLTDMDAATEAFAAMAGGTQ